MIAIINLTPEQLQTKYNLVMNYDRLVDTTNTLAFYISIYGAEMVEKFLNNPGSIHWTVSFKPVEQTSAAERRINVTLASWAKLK